MSVLKTRTDYQKRLNLPFENSYFTYTILNRKFVMIKKYKRYPRFEIHFGCSSKEWKVKDIYRNEFPEIVIRV